MALRGGRASSCEGELGTSVGLVLDRMNEYGNYSPPLFVLDFGHLLKRHFGQSRVV